MTSTDLPLRHAGRYRSSSFHIWYMRVAWAILTAMMFVLFFLGADGFFGLYEAPWHKDYRLAAASVDADAESLAREHRPSELMRRIELFETEDLEPVKALASTRFPDRGDLLRAAREHPYVAYALLMKNLDVTIRREETYLAARQQRLEELRQFAR